jgi:hypothetical protein
MVLLGVLLGVFVLLLCVGGGYLLFSGNNKKDKGGAASQTTAAQTTQTTEQAPATTAAPTGRLINIPCNRLKGQQYDKVEKALVVDNHFKVKKVEQAGGKEGEVLNVEPCAAPRGSEITVTVATGPGGGASSTSGPGGTEPTPACIGGLLGSCPPSSRP